MQNKVNPLEGQPGDEITTTEKINAPRIEPGPSCEEIR